MTYVVHVPPLALALLLAVSFGLGYCSGGSSCRVLPVRRVAARLSTVWSWVAVGFLLLGFRALSVAAIILALWNGFRAVRSHPTFHR